MRRPGPAFTVAERLGALALLTTGRAGAYPRKRVREVYEQVLEGYDRVKEDLERAQERTRNALRFLEDAE